MKRTLVALLAVLTIACGSVSLPPIEIIVPVPTPSEPGPQKPEEKPRATLAVVLTDESGAAIANERVSIAGDGNGGKRSNGTNADGFVAFETEQDNYTITAGDFSGGKYQTTTDRVALSENRQVSMTLRLTTPPAPPASEKPFQNLNVWVIDSVSGAPVAGARVEIVNGESRIADGGGFVNFGVRDAATLRVTAADYTSDLRSFSPGDHKFLLVSTKPKPVPPPPATALSECTKAKNRAFGSVTAACLQAVANVSPNYVGCTGGSDIACHLYVREVVAALRAGDDAPEDRSYGWGLITKSGGEQGCNDHECDGNAAQPKFGEDMVAYLNQGLERPLWRGLDVIGGAGAPGARFQSGALPGPVGGRPTNLWAPVPAK